MLRGSQANSKVSQEEKHLEEDSAIMLRRGNSLALFPNTQVQPDFELIEVNMKAWSHLNSVK